MTALQDRILTFKDKILLLLVSAVLFTVPVLTFIGAGIALGVK